MKIKKTKFKDLLILQSKVIKDNRGFFTEVFKKNILEKELGFSLDFVQQNKVKSFQNVLRGLHFQLKPHDQSKLVSVEVGEIIDYAVDLRKNSETYGQYFSYKLSEKYNESLFIPKGFAHGYLTTSKMALVNYCVDNYYNKTSERGISFNDKFLNINLGVKTENLIISNKDKNLRNFSWQ